MNKLELNLTKNFYTAKNVGKNITFQKILLVKNDASWNWEGVIHEQIVSSKPTEGEMLTGVINEYNSVQGDRTRKKNKLAQDIEILKKALQKEPKNPRYLFYLAQTYLIDGQLENAIFFFQKRVELSKTQKTCPEETFWSLYSIGCLQSDLKKESSVVIDSFLTAFAFDETRAEPLFRLAVEFQLMESYILGYLVIEKALKIPRPSAALQIQHAVYDYLLELKKAELAWLLGRAEESLEQYKKLLHLEKIPETTREMVQKNVDILSTVRI